MKRISRRNFLKVAGVGQYRKPSILISQFHYFLFQADSLDMSHIHVLLH